MISDFYLSRRLSDTGKTYTEEELLSASNCIIVLSEPGGGKTELLNNLAKKLDTDSVTANMFAHVGTDEVKKPLVIDAFDELAKIDESGIYKLLTNVKKACPTHIIISSRSSEWDNSTSNAIKQFGYQPLLVNLCEFDGSEQRTIFQHHVPEEDFCKFHAEVSRFDLDALLANPQFLKMFADAYLESDRKFTDKHSIFKQAIIRLAKEANQTAANPKHALSAQQKVDISSQIFTKLLLSGCEGISISETNETRIYPFLPSLVNTNLSDNAILATRLFKLGDNSDQHRPVHKIITEYCAAEYLCKRIANPADPLTLHQCLPIIAPNSTVRNELRGLLGWMAALGNTSIQIAAIDLDPYAVLANGDPSQLEPSSKKRLLSKLKEIEASDPYFRRSDFWRRFNVAGFFTEDIAEEVKALLVEGSYSHLRNLILELLAGSPVIGLFKEQLKQFALNPQGEKNNRIFSSECLFQIADHDIFPDLKILINEASSVSLEIVARGIKALNPKTLELSFLEELFRACTKLYRSHKNQTKRVFGERLFIKRLIDELDLVTIERLLDCLTEHLICHCSLESYECYCRNGISKIVGSMLDRYFEIATPPFAPLQVWGWLKNLNFHGNKSKKNNKSVQVLSENIELRQGILAHVFAGLTDSDQIFKTKLHKFDLQVHSGLRFSSEDNRFLVDLAFEVNNADLWGFFIQHHYYYHNKNPEANPLRSHMRKQAREKSALMRKWAISNRKSKQQIQEERNRNRKHDSYIRRNKKRQNKIHSKNIQYVQNNHELIESGHHWSCLLRFADLVLQHPEKIEIEFGDELLVRNALRNCLDFIEPQIPDLQKLAQLQCESKYMHVESILFAACIEIMRTHGNLNNVNPSFLSVLKTNFNTSYSAIKETEHNALKNEVNRLLFSNLGSAEKFLRQYLEPQLESRTCSHPEVWLLEHDEIFSSLKETLSIEWLSRFNEVEYFAIESLFNIAAQYGNRVQLEEIILTRCSVFLSQWPEPTEDEKFEQRRKFWFIRAFYFLEQDKSKPYFEWLKSDKNTLLLLESRSGRMNRNDDSYWPTLTSHKIEATLDAFFEQWPKVHLPTDVTQEPEIVLVPHMHSVLH